VTIDRSKLWTGDLNARALEPQPRVTVGLYDRTLSGAERTAGVALAPEDEQRLALALAEAGVDRIEAPGTEGAAAAGRLLAADLPAEVWARARVHDLGAERLAEVGVRACVLEAPLSGVRLAALGESLQAVLERIRSAVSVAAGAGLEVAFAGGDVTRAELDVVRRAYELAVEAGAREVVVSDSVGVATPEAAAFLVGEVADRLGPGVAVHWEGHDDFGLATAASVAAVQAGATWVHVAVDGIGERSGAADVAEMALALEALYGIPTRFRLERVHALAGLLREVADGAAPGAWKSASGEAVFVHETETAASEPAAIEPYAPELVGAERRFVLGASSGLDAVRAKLAQLGVDVPDERLPGLVEAVRALAHKKGASLADAEVRRLAARRRR
jgi:isopropylmalate/homocitrate/citramalate synthase